MKKNILLIVQNNSFPFDKRVLREANSLKGDGNNVFVISPKSNHDKESSIIINGISVRRYKDFVAKGGVWGYICEYLNSVTRIFLLTFSCLIRHKISVVHVANPPDFFWPIAIICKVFGINFIYDQHDLSPEMSRSKFNSNFIFKLLLWNEKQTVKYATGIIVVNETFKKRLITKWNINPDKCTVVYNGPAGDFLPLRNDEIVKKYENKKVVLYIGLMTVNDNIEIIINTNI